MAVITISRQSGSGGDEVAGRVCDALGYCYFDKRLMEGALARENLTPQNVMDYREDIYKMRSFAERLLGWRPMRPLPDPQDWAGMPTSVTQGPAVALDENMAIWVVDAAIKAAYLQGNVVIVGRGGQAVLHDKAGVLHVRIEAPLAQRVRWVGEHDHLGEREAAQCITDHDGDAADYLKRFYGANWADPMLYHLLMNTGKMSVQMAAQTIITAARCMEA